MNFVAYCARFGIVAAVIMKLNTLKCSGPNGHAGEGVDLGARGSTEREIESRRRHGCLSLVGVLCCGEEVSATSWSLVQKSHIKCRVSLSVI
jgi:hypothetical protein